MPYGADHDDTGTQPTIYIDRSGNNAADIYGMQIVCDNAGAGTGYGINMEGFAAGEALLGVPADTAGIGAAYGRIAVYVTGVGIKYVLMSEAA